MRVRPVRKSLQPGFLVGFSRLRPRCVSKKARLCRVTQIIRGHMSKIARVCRALQFRILPSQCLGRSAVSRDLGSCKLTHPVALSRFGIALHNRTFFDICQRNSCIALHTRTFLAGPARNGNPLTPVGKRERLLRRTKGDSPRWFVPYQQKAPRWGAPSVWGA